MPSWRHFGKVSPRGTRPQMESVGGSMAKRTIVVMPGDGIGKLVTPEAIRVLEAAGFEADWIEADIGWDCWCRMRRC